MRAALALTLVLLLGACGGNGDDDTASTDPVDCRARPELCQ